MNDSAPALRSEPEPLADSDYDTILAAVMETARGRWFLHEFAHRNRNADTGMLLTAINRIESFLIAREDAATPSPAMAAAPAQPQIAAQVPTQGPAQASAVLARIRDITETLIECGAPTYLCNDLAGRIEELAHTLATPADAPAPVQAVARTNIVEIAAPEPPRDPIADILALSPEERIALFT